MDIEFAVLWILCGFSFTYILSSILQDLTKSSILKKFKKLKAFSPETAVTVEQLELDSIGRRYLNILIEEGKIKKTRDKRYYVETENEGFSQHS